MDEYAAGELREANDALSDVDELLQVDVTEKPIVNRLYYACFHAARAALHTRGFDPSTHQGVVSLFGREAVKKGDASGDDGRFVNEMRTYRTTADYEHEPLDVDINALYERTKTFVSDMDALA